jgi:hypothetical protein
VRENSHWPQALTLTAALSDPGSARCRRGAPTATRRARNAWQPRRPLSRLSCPQGPKYRDAPLKVVGEHDEGRSPRMLNCMAVGNFLAGVICADGHLGYAQPVGGVITYEKQISISGVGFDNLGSKESFLFVPPEVTDSPSSQNHVNLASSP